MEQREIGGEWVPSSTPPASDAYLEYQEYSMVGFMPIQTQDPVLGREGKWSPPCLFELPSRAEWLAPATPAWLCPYCCLPTGEQ